MIPGKRIKDIRKSLGLTQASFGECLGAKWFKIKDIESGRLQVTEEFAKKINREFGFNYKWILIGEMPKKKSLGEIGEIVIANVDTGPLIELQESELLPKVEEAAKKIWGEQSGNVPEEVVSSANVNLDVFFVNPAIVAYALKRAGGKCEVCHSDAPFLKASDNQPYLEIHHVVPICKGGPTSVDDILAICPNCHRKLHFG